MRMRGLHYRRRSASLLAAVALWAGQSADAAAQGNAAADRAALEALYDATGGPGWTDSTNWNTSAPIGEWFGVSTGAAGRVTGLELPGNGLTGPIPAALGDLTLLQTLNLGRRWVSTSQQSFENALTGPIPSELGRLVNLERLQLWGNALTGPVPAWLGNLTGLRSLNLSENEFTGPVPDELGNLANLELLNLGSNPLTGSLPQSLTRLSQLMWLYISNTGACAPANAQFQAWLETIEFSGDTCNRPPEPVGTVPPQALAESGPALGVSMEAYFSDPDDDRLTYAAASSNAGAVTAFASGDTVWLAPGAAGTASVTVTAQDPDGLSATQAMTVTTAASAGPQSDREVLEALYDATGGESWTDSTNWKTAAPLGEWFGVTTDADGRVTTLVLYGNGLADPIPGALGRLENLEYLQLSGNDLTGPIPAELGGLASLEYLDLSSSLAGPIPAELGGLASLEYLDLGGNAWLTGPVPEWLGNLTRLRWLSLGFNDLTGPIPEELGDLVNLEGLDLGWNDLTGSIPAELGRLQNLKRMYLNVNDLTGPIPAELGRLQNLEWLILNVNALTGPVPAWLGNLTGLRLLHLDYNDLTGPIPSELGRLENLEQLYLSYNWGLSGSLPSGLESSRLEQLDIFVTQACAPAALQDWLETIEFWGPVCGSGTDVTIDVAVVYTPAARVAAGGAAAIAAVIDLMVAEANQAYAASGVNHRLALVDLSEVAYTETGTSGLDLDRLADPADGHMDEVHALRDRVGADLVHLIVDRDKADVGGIARLPGVFGLTVHSAGGRTFAHELGHNMGLRHDRYQVDYNEGGVSAHPAYGYVNAGALSAGAARSRRWTTMMAYHTQCADAYFSCSRLLRFSNPRQRYDGDPLGVPHGTGETGVTGPADAAAVLNATGPAVALWRDRPDGTNRPPAPAGTLPDRLLTLPGTLDVDVSAAFVDPDGDALTYAVSSSAPSVVTVSAAGARVTLTAVSAGTATIRVTAMDPGGLSAAQAFTVSVSTGAAGGFTDDPLRPGVTPVRAIHFTELRARIDSLREAAGLGRFRWTDPVLRAGVTPVRLVHLTELREALGAAYTAAGRAGPRWTDAAPTAGTTPIRAAHLTELRAAVVALE